MPYVEFLWVAYHHKIPYVPSYRPTYDVQLGLVLWLSFGQTGG